MDQKVGFIGFGHMAQILCKAILDQKLIRYKNLFFTRRNKEKAEKDAKDLQITFLSLQDVVSSADVLIFCSRPQDIESVFQMADFSSCNASLFITILAGTPISYFEKKLGPKAEILRVMPNVTIEVGEGMSAMAHNSPFSNENLDLAKRLFSALGEVEIMEEKYLDIVTGLCGSSPAFIYQLIDAIAQPGIKDGLNPQKALKMVAQTFLGTAKLIKEGRDPHQMTDSMRLRGGATVEGLKIFESSPIKKSLELSVKAVIDRARELSKPAD